MRSDRIKVSIADDHPLVISGIRSVLANYPMIELLSSYANGDSLLTGLQEVQPDILLLDIQMPGKTGDVLAPLVLKQHPNVRIITLTNFDSALYVNNMLKLGVNGYLLKSAEEKVIVEAITTVYNGGVFIEDSLKQKLESLEDKIAKTSFSKVSLTPREKEVLRLIAAGNTNQEIADALFLSIRTVENYRLNLQLKLEAKNTAVLIIKALQLGLIDG